MARDDSTAEERTTLETRLKDLRDGVRSAQTWVLQAAPRLAEMRAEVFRMEASQDIVRAAFAELRAADVVSLAGWERTSDLAASNDDLLTTWRVQVLTAVAQIEQKRRQIEQWRDEIVQVEAQLYEGWGRVLQMDRREP